jgi:hypothetical protein
LPSRDVGVVADEFRVIVAGDDEVSRAPRNGLEVQHVRLGGADVEPAARRVVEDDDVLVARQHGRQAVVHLVLVLGGVAVGRLVVERHAPAAAVHAEHALAAAEQLLAVIQCEADAAQGFVRVVAVLFGDQRQAIAQEVHANRRFFDDGAQPVDRELERIAVVHDAGGHCRRRAGEGEGRQLPDAVFAVVDFEGRVVDRGDAHLADVGLHDQRLA